MSKHKTAVITGASSGIGAALAPALAREGMNLVIGARRRQRLDETATRVREAGGRVMAMVCDVTRREEAEELIHRAAREFGTIDVLVNNAGRGHLASVEDTTDDVIASMFAVNVYALWHTTRPALTYMKRQGTGHIVNVASIAGKLGFAFNSAYVAAKHACVGFTHALRLELAETGIQASVVCPAGATTEWAAATEGGPILPLFSEAGPLIAQIAAERGIGLPPIASVMTAEEVAEKIVECIHHPVAEVYTHPGSREFLRLAAEQWELAEHRQTPAALAERKAYERLRPRSPDARAHPARRSDGD